MKIQRDFFLLMTLLVAAAPAFGQTNDSAQGGAATPDFSGIWVHPFWPGFDPPLSGLGPVVNRSRLPSGVRQRVWVANTPWKRQTAFGKSSAAGERLHAGPEMRAAISPGAPPRTHLSDDRSSRDLNQGVARSAACALGQIGRIEARPMLAKLLREEPSEEVIDAVSSIADEACMVQLG
jgi:hypothetical protein